MAKSCVNIWSYGSTEAANVGTRFHHRIVEATATPKVSSASDKIFNIVFQWTIPEQQKI